MPHHHIRTVPSEGKNGPKPPPCSARQMVFRVRDADSLARASGLQGSGMPASLRAAGDDVVRRPLDLVLAFCQPLERVDQFWLIRLLRAVG